MIFDQKRGYLSLVKDEDSGEDIERQGEDIEESQGECDSPVAEMPDRQMFDLGEPGKQADAEFVWQTCGCGTSEGTIMTQGSMLVFFCQRVQCGTPQL